MSDRGSEYGLTTAFIVIVIALLLFTWLTVEVSFPTFEYANDPERGHLIPVEPYDDVAAGVSRFLWENRALDIMNQAFVIVVAIVCCLALLKPEADV